MTRRLPIIAALAGTLLLVSTTAAMACKPQEVIRDPQATVCIHGDPFADFGLDNTASTVAVPFRLVFWTGRTDVRVVQVRTVPAGQSLDLTRFVHGGGRKVAVYDDQTGAVLVRFAVTPRTHLTHACQEVS